MNARNNIFQILRQEDKIKRKSKQLKESQQKKENEKKESEKKDASSFSFDISKYSSWADMVDEYDEFFYEVEKLNDQEKNETNNNKEKKKKKTKKKKKKEDEYSDDSSEEDKEDTDQPVPTHITEKEIKNNKTSSTPNAKKKQNGNAANGINN
ncbi:hypothetical protein AK88_05494, partial [Plasmodium fragile]